MKIQIGERNSSERQEEKQEITVVHPEIISVYIRKPEDIAIIAQQLRKEVEMRLQDKSIPRSPKPTIEEEIDEEIHKNHTQNPLPPDETILIDTIKTNDDDDRRTLDQLYAKRKHSRCLDQQDEYRN